jgi:hypothetical protein
MRISERTADLATAMAARDTGRASIYVMATPPEAFDRLKPHWRGLADKALTPNPFMAPEFLEPAAMHLAQRGELTLAAIFRKHARSDELIGLFAMGSTPRRTFPFGRAGAPTLWVNPCFADATPLLSSDADDAAAAAGAMLDAFGAAGRGGLTLPAVAEGSLTLSALVAAAEARGLAARTSSPDTHSRGLHMVLHEPAEVASVTVARDPAPLMAMTEQALAMDAILVTNGRRGPELRDQRFVSFVRAAIRGFSHTRSVVIARYEKDGRRAAALAWLSADKAFIWRLFGPDAQDPRVEAALAHAIGSATGKTPVGASHFPISGFGTQAHPTQTVRLVPMA